MAGNELFGVDIAGIIGDVIGNAVLDVTVTRYVQGAREPGNLTGGRSKTPVTFEGKGFFEDYTGLTPPGTILQANDRKALLIGDTFSGDWQPLRNDQITVHENGGSVTMYVTKLQSRDPAAAVYTYQCSDRRGPDGV